MIVDNTSAADPMAARQALNNDRHAIPNAVQHCPDKPGLFAVFGPSHTWTQLGLNRGSGDPPLYVGKAEDSLVQRDLGTHFSTGKTGSSTLRRSLAALLRDALDLRAVPHDPEKPGYFANFGLEPTMTGGLASG
jgi:GIY-YIG catalytic domain-containing protein